MALQNNIVVSLLENGYCALSFIIEGVPLLAALFSKFTSMTFFERHFKRYGLTHDVGFKLFKVGPYSLSAFCISASDTFKKFDNILTSSVNLIGALGLKVPSGNPFINPRSAHCSI